MKKKPAKKPRTPHEIEMSRLMREARASCSLDGQTNYCAACEDQAATHTCHLRPMTAEERAVVEAAMRLQSYTYKGTMLNILNDRRDELFNACRALRAEREVKRG